MHIDERKYAYGYTISSNGNRVLKSKYDIYLYGIQDINITNLSANSQWVFTYCGDESYVGDISDNTHYNIPRKYLDTNSILSVTGFIVEDFEISYGHQAYYPLPYFEPEDNPGSGIDIKSVVVRTSPVNSCSAIIITVNKHTHCGTWESDSNTHYHFCFKIESSGFQL